MDVREMAEQFLPEAVAAAQDLSRLKGFSLKSLGGAVSCVKWAVKKAQSLSELSNEEKQAFVVELVLRVVKLPFWLEPVARAVLPHVVDVVVDALKDKFDGQ